MTGYDMHIRITNKDRESHVDVKRVWNGPRLLESLKQQYSKEGATVESITKKQYDHERKAK